ncbi:MAG: ABC transporter substrate-binding protein [Hyphomonadaceae bacterium]|jgi:NitT/TauT family transport system substrate-binding protein|nr:ABC transporter substrate-binding protein [Hyphomonadaceae bacterium]
MQRSIAWAALALTLVAAASSATAQVQTVRVGWCAKTISSAAAPFAIATKLGWFEKDGVKVDLVPLPGSTDCVKLVATKELQASLPSVEPLAIIRPQGVKAKFFYTAYQANIYGIAVPESSTVKSITDLKGKKIGVTSMASAGVIVARALAKQAGLNPDSDISIIVAGESAQTAALLGSKQVDALSQFDTQYALAGNAGAKLRLLDHPEIKKFPSNGFVALEDYLKTNRKEAVALARGYARGTVFALANPEAAIRILWEVYPQTRATGKDEATALRDDLITLQARARNWGYEQVDGKRWGDNVEANYQAYLTWLLEQGIIKTKTDTTDIITNALLDDVNAFDEKAVIAEAKAYKAK